MKVKIKMNVEKSVFLECSVNRYVKKEDKQCGCVYHLIERIKGFFINDTNNKICYGTYGKVEKQKDR